MSNSNSKCHKVKLMIIYLNFVTNKVDIGCKTKNNIFEELKKISLLCEWRQNRLINIV